MKPDISITSSERWKRKARAFGQEWARALPRTKPRVHWLVLWTQLPSTELSAAPRTDREGWERFNLHLTTKHTAAARP